MGTFLLWLAGIVAAYFIVQGLDYLFKKWGW